MEFKSAYVAKQPDEKGFLQFTAEEDSVWATLYERQMKIVQNRACAAYLQGLQQLALPKDKVPQLRDVSTKLKAATGWAVMPVAALISAEEFFTLLANRKFPCATFIRRRDEIDYVKEPDIFHELFGHCPMLCEPVFAKFMEDYAKIVLDFPQEEWALLQRFFWFTVEFGLINCVDGTRIYGGGILSSIGETPYCLESDIPQRKPFDFVEILRTPYRIDMKQTVYYVIDSFKQLYDVIDSDISAALAKAHELGELTPTFPVDLDNPSVHIGVC